MPSGEGGRPLNFGPPASEEDPGGDAGRQARGGSGTQMKDRLVIGAGRISDRPSAKPCGKRSWGVAAAIALLVLLGGCAANVGVPQNREAFVERVGPGGPFRFAEHLTVNRPYAAVVADLADCSGKCLNVRVMRPPDFRRKELGGWTTYHPNIETTRRGVTTFSVQEEYGHPRATSGDPPGGLFVLVAEIRAAEADATRVDIYHVSRSHLADPLKRWIQGADHRCPTLDCGP